MQHLKERRDPLTEAILADTEHMLAQGRMDVPLSLCFAATRGDDLLLHQLLRRGMDPNELDSNGRTALVCISCFLLHICVTSAIYKYDLSAEIISFTDTAYCSIKW